MVGMCRTKEMTLTWRTRRNKEYDYPYINLLTENVMAGRDPNDDRSNSMNPNNDAYWDSLENRSNQLNPNNPEYKGDDYSDDN